MADTIIVCPNCKEKIPLTEAITHNLREDLRKEIYAESRKKEAELKEKAQALDLKEKNIQDTIEQEVAKEVLSKQEKIKKEISRKIEEENSLKLKSLEEDLLLKKKQLQDLRKTELDLRRQKAELEECQKSVDLEVARKIDEERAKIQEIALKKASDEHMFKDKEKEKLIADLKKQVEELNRKMEQGSQQTQGEVAELELEDILKSAFPLDNIEPVAKGIKGADILHRINNHAGQHCGTIIWESKCTKGWSDTWIDKLKNDQREVKAEIAALMSTSLPKEVRSFGLLKGVWVTDYASAVNLAIALRMGLIDVANTKQSAVGKHEKMEAVYAYLSGKEFKQKIEAIVEAFVTMQQDLESEKRVMEKQWSKREQQIRRIITSTARMYGDMQAIIGASLPQIKNLELKALTDETNTVNANE